jgi:hypothetical protein
LTKSWRCSFHVDTLYCHSRVLLASLL